MPNFTGQTTYPMFSAFALPGQLADLTYCEIQTFLAAEVIQFGVCVEIAADGLSVQQVQQTSTTFNPVGISVFQAAREGNGPIGFAGLAVQGPFYQIGDPVPVLMRGRIYAAWSGTTQPTFGKPNIFHSSTIATTRGVFTDTASPGGVGTEVAAGVSYLRSRSPLPGTGNIILIDVNLPGAA